MGLDNQNIHGADALVAKLKAAKLYLQNDAPEVIGTEAVKHFKQNFVNEGFDSDKWAARKTKVKLQRKILTGQGNGDHLGDSIDYRIEGKTIIIFTDKVYAQIHNEGGTIKVTEQMKKYFWAMNYQAKAAGDTEMADQYKAMALSKQITIVQRKFMGESPLLTNKIIDKIKRDLKRILKN
jgi:phage gpG-like protein